VHGMGLSEPNTCNVLLIEASKSLGSLTLRAARVTRMRTVRRLDKTSNIIISEPLPSLRICNRIFTCSSVLAGFRPNLAPSPVPTGSGYGKAGKAGRPRIAL